MWITPKSIQVKATNFLICKPKWNLFWTFQTQLIPFSIYSTILLVVSNYEASIAWLLMVTGIANIKDLMIWPTTYSKILTFISGTQEWDWCPLQRGHPCGDKCEWPYTSQPHHTTRTLFHFRICFKDPVNRFCVCCYKLVKWVCFTLLYIQE